MQDKEKPFSETLKVLLKFSKEYPETFDIESIKKCLGDIYHPEMKLKDILIVLDNALCEAIEIKEFEMPNRKHAYLDIIMSPFNSCNPLGGKFFGPNLKDAFSVEQFYNKIISEYMHKFMFTNIGWCREYVFPDEQSKE